MSVSAIDISALASQLTSNFLASLTNATVVTNNNSSTSTLPIKYEREYSLNLIQIIFI
jgi:hypothetical protein